MRFIFLVPIVTLALSCSPATGDGSPGDGDGDGDGDGAIGDGDGDTMGTGSGGAGTGTGGIGVGASGSGGAPVGSGGGAGAAPATGGGPSISGPLTMGYILNLESVGSTGALDTIDFTASDYVIHAFYTADAAGNLVSVTENVDTYRNAGLVTKVHEAGKRIVMSLGGANHSGPLKTVAANPGLRATFVADVVAKINEWGYDGVDLDLEFPIGGNEPQDFLALMTDLHNAVKANNAEHLTMFGIGPGYYNDQYLWSDLAGVSDYGFYFCYDWDWPGLTTANGPIHNPSVPNYMTWGMMASFEGSCKGAMNYIISQGYPGEKLIVGLPFYSAGGTHWSSAPAGAKTAIPDAQSMEASFGGDSWTNVASLEMKIDAVLDPTQTVLAGGATAAGIGWWEWGYEDPASPELSAAIKAKLGK